jgi:hypothetical protein
MSCDRFGPGHRRAASRARDHSRATCFPPGLAEGPQWPAGGVAIFLDEELFGKHVPITDHDDRSAAEVIAGYRSQSEAEFSFRQLKDPRVVSFSPMRHCTEHNIRVHASTCVLALQAAHLMRLTARPAGLDLSLRELLGDLAGIGETVLLYQGERARPRTHRMLTNTCGCQILGHLMRPAHTHGSARRADLVSRPSRPAGRQMVRRARAALPAPTRGADGARCSDRRTRPAPTPAADARR